MPKTIRVDVNNKEIDATIILAHERSEQMVEAELNVGDRVTNLCPIFILGAKKQCPHKEGECFAGKYTGTIHKISALDATGKGIALDFVVVKWDEERLGNPITGAPLNYGAINKKLLRKI